MEIIFRIILPSIYGVFTALVGITIATIPFWVGLLILAISNIYIIPMLTSIPEVTQSKSRYHKRQMKAYHNHLLLVNRKHGQIVFKFMGHQFHTSTTRSGAYVLDDKTWRIVDARPFERLWLVLSGKAHKATYRKKALNYGVYRQFL
jgi:hypothetical protein